MAQGAIQLNFEQSLLANALNQPDKSQYVYNLTNGYNTLDLFMSNRAKPRQVVGDGGEFQKAVLGSNAVTGVVSSAVEGNTPKPPSNVMGMVRNGVDIYQL